MKMRFQTIVFTLIITIPFIHSCKERLPDYKNADLSIDERVEDLLSRMTLEEKAAQMVAVNNEVKDSIEFSDNGIINIEKIKPLLRNGIGQITRVSEIKGGNSQTSNRKERAMTAYENALLTNALQKFFIEETRLGIPAIFHEECLHGLVAGDATSYPQPIALAGTFNRELIEKVYTRIALETRSRGAHQALTPVVDVARDARWGRVEETYGEDTYLIAQMGISAVNGFQGDASFKNKDHIVATLKHFAAHGQPENGTNTGPANFSERILREVHFYPFKEIIQKAGALSIMTTYHEIDGVPINANHWLVTGILREEWGFRGFVVSDYFAIREMHERYGIMAHRVAADGKQAAELALNAGVNIELPNPDCYKFIPELVHEGKISEKSIDILVGEMLRVKFMLGLFDDPYVDPENAQKISDDEANKILAKESALESVILLENKNNVVPLDLNKIKSVAVIGPNADRVNLGGYAGIPDYAITPLEGIRLKAGDKTKVNYALGCGLTIGGSWVDDKVTFSDPEDDKIKIKEAVGIAKKSDVVVLILGGNEQTSREAWNIHHLGDVADLDLPGMQDELVDAIHETGKPIIVFLFNGRPLSVNNLKEKADAIFECWYLGQESGNAVADVLFGEYNPGGKLPVSFPRSAGHIPVYYNYKPSARRGYLNNDVTPLYSFGYGLSYTTFEIKNIILGKNEINPEEGTKLSLAVTNTGKQKGSETIQLYIRDEISSVTRPVKELKDFKRVFLEPGETKIVEFEITPEKLAFYDINMDFRVEPGQFTLFIGNSSRDEDLQSINLTVR
jgi:beta-glucosidase